MGVSVMICAPRAAATAVTKWCASGGTTTPTNLRTHRVEQRHRMRECGHAVGLGSPLPPFLPRIAHANQAKMLP